MDRKLDLFRSSESRVDIATKFGDSRARLRLVAAEETADIELEEFKGSKDETDEMQSTLMSVPASAPWINNLDILGPSWTILAVYDFGNVIPEALIGLLSMHFIHLYTILYQCLWRHAGGIRPGMHQTQMV